MMRARICLVIALMCLLVDGAAKAQDDQPETGKSPETAAAENPETTAIPAPPPEAAPKSVLPRSVHAGSVTGIECVEIPVEWVKLDNMILEGRTEPETDVAAQDIEDRPPAEGRCYVIVTILLEDGRSVSRYDYRLRAGTTLNPCLALSVAGRPFDVRQWMYDMPGEVRLLFECPAVAETVDLEFALETDIPQETIAAIPLREQPDIEVVPADAPPETPTESAPPEQAAKREKAEGQEPTTGTTEKPAETANDAPAKAEKPDQEKTGGPEKKKEEPKNDGGLFF